LGNNLTERIYRELGTIDKNKTKKQTERERERVGDDRSGKKTRKRERNKCGRVFY